MYLPTVLLKGTATIWDNSSTGIKKKKKFDIWGYLVWEESKGLKFESWATGLKIQGTSALLTLISLIIVPLISLFS